MKEKDFYKNLMKLTKTDNMRDLHEKIHYFGYNSDFTGMSHVDGSPLLFFKAFVIYQFYDIPKPIYSIEDLVEHAEVNSNDKAKIKRWFKKLFKDE